MSGFEKLGPHRSPHEHRNRRPMQDGSGEKAAASIVTPRWVQWQGTSLLDPKWTSDPKVATMIGASVAKANDARIADILAQCTKCGQSPMTPMKIR
jgi:hypothetical protein